MPSDWTRATLGEITEMLSGGTPSKSNPDFWQGPIPWASAKDMKSYFLLDTEDHISHDAVQKATKLVPAGTVLLLTRGMTLLDDIPICLLTRPMAFNQDVKAVRAKNGLLQEYLPYLLLAHKPNLLGLVDLAGHGTGRLNSTELKDLPVLLPPRDDQRSIAQLLRTIDDRIRNLTDQSSCLESIAQTIFKSWFVTFDPVRAKSQRRAPEGMDADTAALFPNEFWESEVGQLPSGWHLLRAGELMKQFRGSINPLQHSDTLFAHYSLPAFDKGKRPKLEYGREIKSNKTAVPEQAILLSKLNPHIPRVWLPSFKLPENAVCSTEFLVLQPADGLSVEYLYCQFTEPGFAQRFGGLTTGTSNSHQRVKYEYLLEEKLLRPDLAVVAAFTSLAGPLFAKVNANLELQQTFAGLRDTLLPRLISGHLRVPEAEKLVEAVL